MVIPSEITDSLINFYRIANKALQELRDLQISVMLMSPGEQIKSLSSLIDNMNNRIREITGAASAIHSMTKLYGYARHAYAVRIDKLVSEARKIERGISSELGHVPPTDSGAGGRRRPGPITPYGEPPTKRSLRRGGLQGWPLNPQFMEPHFMDRFDEADTEDDTEDVVFHRDMPPPSDASSAVDRAAYAAIQLEEPAIRIRFDIPDTVFEEMPSDLRTEYGNFTDTAAGGGMPMESASAGTIPGILRFYRNEMYIPDPVVVIHATRGFSGQEPPVPAAGSYRGVQANYERMTLIGEIITQWMPERWNQRNILQQWIFPVVSNPNLQDAMRSDIEVQERFGQMIVRWLQANNFRVLPFVGIIEMKEGKRTGDHFEEQVRHVVDSIRSIGDSQSQWVADYLEHNYVARNHSGSLPKR